MAKRNWVVDINTDTDDPLIFGPYTRATAERLRDRLNEIIDGRDEEEGWMLAGAYPIQPHRITALREAVGL